MTGRAGGSSLKCLDVKLFLCIRISLHVDFADL